MAEPTSTSRHAQRGSVRLRQPSRRLSLAAAAAVGWLLTCLAISGINLRAASLTAALDSDTTVVGESVTLSLIFEGIAPEAPPGLPALANLEVQYGGQSSSQSFQFGAGASTRVSKVIHQYSIRPTQPGDYTIPGFTMKIGDQQLTSKPLKLKVTKAPEPPEPGTAENRVAFLRLIVGNTNVYVGEVFPVEIRLYYQSAEQIRMPQLKADGFTLGQMPQPTQTRSQVGNALYNLVVARAAATAAKTGNLELGPAETSLALRIQRNPSRRRDPFDGTIFDDMLFGRYELRPVNLTSETIAMNVLPLPKDNVPKSFTGAVGQFSLTVTASATNVAAGDPITLNVVVEGQGGLDAITLPSLDAWQGFKAYPPAAKTELADQLGLGGRKTFEQVVVPERTDVREIPAFTFAFFDPQQKAYRTLTHPAIPITVRPAATATVQPTVIGSTAAKPAPAAMKDIVHIKPGLGTLSLIAPPLVRTPWFLALQLVPVVAWLLSLAWQRHAESLARNPRLRRQRQVAQTLKVGLSEMQTFVAAGKQDDFFATGFRLLQERLGERCDLPASAITEAVIDERLVPASVSSALVDRLRQLFQLCNQARYAPQSSAAELNQTLTEFRDVLTALGEVELIGR